MAEEQLQSRQFQALFRSESGVVVGTQRTVNYVDQAKALVASVTVRDASDPASPKHVLEFLVSLRAVSPERAASLALPRATALTDVISYFTAAPVGEPRLVSCWESPTGDQQPRDFLQAISHPILGSPRRGIKRDDLLALLIKRLGDIEVEADGSGRVQRAIRAYVRGLREPDVVDRFEDFWQGLEALNPVAQRAFNAEAEKRLCTHCHRPQEIPTTNGVRELAKALLGEVQGAAVYKEGREIRQGLQHGFMTEAELTRRALSVQEDIGRVLAGGIAMLFDLPRTDPEQIFLLHDPRPPFLIGKVKEDQLIRRLENGISPEIVVTVGPFGGSPGEPDVHTTDVKLVVADDGFGLMGDIKFGLPVQEGIQLLAGHTRFEDGSGADVTFSEEVSE